MAKGLFKRLLKSQKIFSGAKFKDVLASDGSVQKVKLPQLFDNKGVNVFLSPFYFSGLLYFFYTSHIPLYSQRLTYFGSIGIAAVSTLIYIWSSHFFQPDLDQTDGNRPGTGFFPIGVTMATSGLIPWIVWKPICFLWNRLWYPYGELATHRGITHWPILSVFLRVGYLRLILKIITFFLTTGLELKIDTSVVDHWFDAFLPWSKTFMTKYWFCYCFPIHLSDLMHELFDMIDSMKKGLSFCPPQIRRGLLAKAYTSITGKRT
jgi:hypothetical protein